jgi:hypothetical protein
LKKPDYCLVSSSFLRATVRARARTRTHTQKDHPESKDYLCREFACDIFFSPHPSYSLDLALSDFHLFTYLKQFRGGGMCKGSIEEVQKTVKDWFNGLAADFYNAGIQKIITQYHDKCLNLHRDYVEK